MLAVLQRATRRTHRIEPLGWTEESPLHHMGYVVGITHGLSSSERRNILAQAFEEDIPGSIPTNIWHSGDEITVASAFTEWRTTLPGRFTSAGPNATSFTPFAIGNLISSG